MTHRTWTLLSTVAAVSLLAGAAFADDQATPPAEAPAAAAPAAAPTPPPAPLSMDGWLKSIKLGGHIEVGATMNPETPSNNINFGHLFTDKANQFVLNQAAVTLERDLDPKATWLDVGFKLQVMYGMDSQFTQFLGELPNQPANNRNQFDIVEANFLAHLPILTPGGIDVKLGQFSTPIGYEVIDPTGNFFYSKSYIFNFGIPLKHTGILTTTHVNPMLDIYAGYTTGVNTSIGAPGGGYNADEPHFLGGIGLNFAKVTILALTHIGPEDPASSPFAHIHKQLRYLNDIVITWKPNSKLTSVTELNYIRDDGFDVSGGGVAQYFTYPLTSTVTAGVRGEVWRDDKGFFVFAFPGNSDFVNAEYGRPNGSYNNPGPTTYGELTFGLNIKPLHMPKELDGTTIRPEVRYDAILAGPAQFGGNPATSKHQVTLAVDLVVPFNF